MTSSAATSGTPHPGTPTPEPTGAPVGRRRRPPVLALALGGVALLSVGAVGSGALVLSTADDVLAALAEPGVADVADPQDGGVAFAADTDTDTDSDSVTGSDSTGVDWGAVAAQVQPSVVAIRVQTADGATGEGSGVVLDAEGHVLTNNHVVAGAAAGGQVQVTLSDGQVAAADVVGLDPATDLAVVLLVDPPQDLAVAEPGSSAALRVGDPVMAVGNPLGLAGTVTTGIVSALDRPVTTQSTGVASGEPVVTAAIQTDAAVNPGNSGGPLFDADGRVVGINSSIAGLGTGAGTSGSIGLGFAIPMDSAVVVAGQLIEDGTAEHARLGVYLADAGADVADGEWAGRRLGAGLSDVLPGSAAADAGLRAGDVVIAVDGSPTTSALSLTALIRALQPGEQVDLVVERDGQAVQTQVIVEAAAA